MKRHRKGLVMALAAGASWGTTSLSARYLVDRRELFPTHVVFWRFLLAVPFLLAAWAIWGRGQRRFEWKDLPEIAGLALLGVTAMANFNFYSAKYTTNINSTIIITASAVIIAVIAWFQGAPVRRGQWAGVLLGLAGVGFIAMAKDQRHTDLTVWQHSMGITFAFLASVSWALYTVLGRRMVEKYGGLRTTVWAICIGAAIQTPVALAAGVVSATKEYLPGDWAVLLWLGLVPTALAFTIWYMALKYIDVTTVGMAQYVSPAISALLGWWWLSESIQWLHLAGAALIFAGLRFAATSKGRPAELARNAEQIRS